MTEDKKFYDYFDKETKEWRGCIYAELKNLGNAFYTYQEREAPAYEEPEEPELEDGWYIDQDNEALEKRGAEAFNTYGDKQYLWKDLTIIAKLNGTVERID